MAPSDRILVPHQLLWSVSVFSSHGLGLPHPHLTPPPQALQMSVLFLNSLFSLVSGKLSRLLTPSPFDSRGHLVPSGGTSRSSVESALTCVAALCTCGFLCISTCLQGGHVGLLIKSRRTPFSLTPPTISVPLLAFDLFLASEFTGDSRAVMSLGKMLWCPQEGP